MLSRLTRPTLYLTTCILLVGICPLIGGCPDQATAEARASTTITASRNDAAEARRVAAQLPDSDSRKRDLLQAADYLDAAANSLSFGVDTAHKSIQSNDEYAKTGKAIGDLIPVPWVGTAVGAGLTTLFAALNSRTSKKLDDQTTETEAARARMNAIITSIQAGTSNPEFASALSKVAPILNAVQASIPGTKEAVDAVQLKISPE